MTEQRLLDLRFFVDDVLARYRIVFLHLKLIRHGALVLVRRVKVASAGRGVHSDLFTHGSILRPSRREHGALPKPSRYRAYR